MTPDRALAVYGTLAPGEVNHHVLLGIEGSWLDGYVLGYEFEVCLSPSGSRIPSFETTN